METQSCLFSNVSFKATHGAAVHPNNLDKCLRESTAFHRNACGVFFCCACFKFGFCRGPKMVAFQTISLHEILLRLFLFHVLPFPGLLSRNLLCFLHCWWFHVKDHCTGIVFSKETIYTHPSLKLYADCHYQIQELNARASSKIILFQSLHRGCTSTNTNDELLIPLSH